MSSMGTTTTMKPEILAIGANPAWQKVLQFEHFKYDAVNRAESMWSFASGKGINFARAAKIWDRAEVTLLQFAGGDNGKLLLDNLQHENLQVKTFPSAFPTRCCTTCLSKADGTMTELIEPSQGPGKESVDAAMSYIVDKIQSVRAIALCGQLPSGMDIDFYVKCAGLAADNGKLLLIDSWKNVAPVLQKAHNAILKVNADELLALTGMNEIIPAMKMLLDTTNLGYLAITDGCKQAYFADRNCCWSYTVPRLAEVVNPVGSGDTASAVLLSSMLAAVAPERAFAEALAAASANCLSMKCGQFEFYQAINLLKDIQIQKL